MRVKIIWDAESLESNDKELEFEGKKAKIEDVLRKAGINPVTVLVKINDKIVPTEEEVEGDVLELHVIPVVSGG